MSKQEILIDTTFGKRIAEEEADALSSYFVETDQWRKVIAGEVDIVYGAKGSGKSAIYSLLLNKKEELIKRRIAVVAGENVRGTPAFQALVTDPPSSEEQFRNLWKFYFLSLVGTAFRVGEFQTEQANRVTTALEEAELIAPAFSLRRILQSALDYVRRLEVAGEVKINPVTGIPEGVGGKVTLGEPKIEQRRQGFVSADTLLEWANEALKEVGVHLWIILDRLDVAFAESTDLEGNALRALFRVYLDLAGFENIKIKIFLRDDIWQRITTGGFREASHITRYIRISWTNQSLLNLVIRRALHNPVIAKNYDVLPEDILGDTQKQEDLFYRIFPEQVDLGARKSTTFDWMLSRTADGTKQTAPRELIHLLAATRDEQLKLLELGNPEPTGEAVIDRSALKAALPEVSKVRFEQTLCAEHPTFKDKLLALEGEKTQQTPRTLAKAWHLKESDALAVAEQLTEIGFFEKRGTKEEPVFWVPFLYRDALKMVQGPAD